jgi:hypothetical protein
MHLLQDWTRKDHLSNVQAMLPRELKLRPGDEMGSEANRPQARK